MKALESNGFVSVKDYAAYVRFNIFKGKYYRVKEIFLAVFMTLVCLALVLLGIAKRAKGFFIAAGIVLLCCIMFGYVLKVNVKNYCKSKEKLVRAKQKAVFGKNGLIHELLLEPEPEHNEYFYEDLEKVYLTKSALYMYFDSKTSLIIPGRNTNMSYAETKKFLETFIDSQKLVICL